MIFSSLLLPIGYPASSTSANADVDRTDSLPVPDEPDIALRRSLAGRNNFVELFPTFRSPKNKGPTG
jgi:hypothetical protein